MDVTANCPRCERVLQPAPEGEGSLVCSACGGMFLPGSDLRSEILKELAGEKSGEAGDVVTTAVPLGCPGCAAIMQEIPLGDSTVDFCLACGGTWLDAGEMLTGDQPVPEAAAGSIPRYLLYGLSLPERVLRSTVGMAAGAAKETAALLMPQAFQSSKTYEIVIRNSLKFLTEDIGGVEGKQEETSVGENYMARKAVGNFVDMAGWATLHLSPVWLMAVVSDVAYGTKSYVIELADELKKQGLIDENSTINHIDDVLDAVQKASGETAGLFDTPPLSVEELRKSVETTRASIASANYRRVLPEAEINSYWQEMRDIAGEEGVSLIGVSGALTMHTIGKVGTVTKGTLAGVQVAGGLFNRHVVNHYADALKAVREKGFYQFVSESSAPYIGAVWKNFSVDKETWTEQLVSGKAIGSAFRAVSGLLRGTKKEPPKPAPGESSCSETEQA